ncbi:MAG: MurR/RpiR family transcriptional regulator [Clostridia bacterium]|nr:MurR/RpiR family transcriptional regulator [Clostridia bacterium]
MKENIINTIKSRMGGFSKGQKRIAEYLLKHYESAAYMTASRLASSAGVSESTVVRFAADLGFDGYPGMQKALREQMQAHLTSVQRVEVSNSLIGGQSVLDRVLSGDSSRIRETLETIDRSAFDEAVERIIASRRIYILGVRSSSAVAEFLNYYLRMIFDNVTFLRTTSGSEIFEQLLNVGDGDVFIAVSFPRYSSRIVNAVEYAHGAGADVVSITDGPGSPLAPFTDQLLAAKSDMVSFVDSLAAPLSVVNALLAAVARRCPERVRDRLEKLEGIWDEYGVYSNKN